MLGPLAIRFVRTTIDVRTCVVNYWVCLNISDLFGVCVQIDKGGITLTCVPGLDIEDQGVV